MVIAVVEAAQWPGLVFTSESLSIQTHPSPQDRCDHRHSTVGQLQRLVLVVPFKMLKVSPTVITNSGETTSKSKAPTVMLSSPTLTEGPCKCIDKATTNCHQI